MTQTMSGATTTSRTKIRDAACSICVVASADDDDDAVADPAACSSSPVIILIGPQSYEWRKLECSGSGLCRDHGHDNMVMVTVAAVRHRRHGHGQSKEIVKSKSLFLLSRQIQIIKNLEERWTRKVCALHEFSSTWSGVGSGYCIASVHLNDVWMQRCVSFSQLSLSLFLVLLMNKGTKNILSTRSIILMLNEHFVRRLLPLHPTPLELHQACA